MTGHPISWSLQITNLFWYAKYWGSLTAPKTSKLYCTRRWDLVLHRFTFLEPHTSGLHLLKKTTSAGYSAWPFIPAWLLRPPIGATPFSNNWVFQEKTWQHVSRSLRFLNQAKSTRPNNNNNNNNNRGLKSFNPKIWWNHVIVYGYFC